MSSLTLVSSSAAMCFNLLEQGPLEAQGVVADGGGDRGNAWLTVLRHETSVSVLKGAQGGLHNSEQFWPFCDWLNNWNFSARGDDAGWLDLTYYDAPEL